MVSACRDLAIGGAKVTIIHDPGTPVKKTWDIAGGGLLQVFHWCPGVLTPSQHWMYIIGITIAVEAIEDAMGPNG